MIDEYGTMVLASPHTDEWMAMPPEADFKITLEDWRASLEASEKQ
jgi:hypothetical protein